MYLFSTWNQFPRLKNHFKNGITHFYNENERFYVQHHTKLNEIENFAQLKDKKKYNDGTHDIGFVNSQQKLYYHSLYLQPYPSILYNTKLTKLQC